MEVLPAKLALHPETFHGAYESHHRAAGLLYLYIRSKICYRAAVPVVWVLLYIDSRLRIAFTLVLVVHFLLNSTLALEERIDRYEHAVFDAARGGPNEVCVLEKKQ